MPRFRRPRSRFLVLGCALALLLAPPLRADVLVLDDGRRIEGTILAEGPKEVEIKTRFGTFTFARAEIVEIIKGKTREQEYEERLAACETAQEFYELGLWCEEKKLRKRAEKIFGRAIEVDPDHEGARTKLGFVRYKGAWMTPAERDKRQAEDFAAEMRARGLVEHAGRWVTPEEKEHLAAGRVLHGGRWLPEEEAMRLQGKEKVDGEWIPKERARARRAIAGFTQLSRRGATSHVGENAVLIGNVDPGTMERISRGIDRGRAWFDGAFGAKPGLDLFGGQLAEFYVFDGSGSADYAKSVGWCAGRSDHVPEGWAEAVKKSHGFTWIDPIPISSARQWSRATDDLVGHCYHHLGHLMVARLGYDGRLLPAWFEEGVAGVTESRCHDENRVFCRSSLNSYQGSQSGLVREDFDATILRDGSWIQALKTIVETRRSRPFDKLFQLEFSQLDYIDIAQSMSIVFWLEAQGGEALENFTRELRRGAPEPPVRVILAGHERQAVYDKAFQAAVGMGFRRAEGEWRTWFLNL